MNLEGIRPPSAFPPSPGKPTVTWETWKSRFFTYMHATGGDAFAAARKRAILLHCLGDEGQRICETLPPAVKLGETETGFDLTLRQLDGFFIPKVNVIVERFTFRRHQRPAESTAEYVSVLRGLAATCRYGDMADDIIRDMVVGKAVHQRLREKLLQDPELTLDRTPSVADAFERALRESAVMSGQQLAPVVATLARQPPRRQQKRTQPTAEHPVAYWSRTFTHTERRYSVSERQRTLQGGGARQTRAGQIRITTTYLCMSIHKLLSFLPFMIQNGMRSPPPLATSQGECCRTWVRCTSLGGTGRLRVDGDGDALPLRRWARAVVEDRTLNCIRAVGTRRVVTWVGW